MQENVAQDSQDIDFLTDFLYVDQRRVNSLIAQLVRSGLLTGYKEEFSETDSRSGEFGVKLGLQGKASGAQQESQKIVREYDSSHSLPLLLLDLLDAHHFIKRGVDNAQLGNIVLVSGEYRLFDISTLEKVLPLLQEQKFVNSKDQKTFKKTFDLFPKSLQLDLTDGKYNYWSPLKKENLVIDTEDLLLSNGVHNLGEWYILGLLENTPNQQAAPKFKDEKAAFSELYEHIKQMIGKPNNSYGVSPILIFRKITK